MPDPKVNPSDGGTEIKVDTDPVVIPKEEGEEQAGDQPEVGDGGGAEVKLVNEALVETVVRVLGKTLALVTKIPEMDFDESETTQLTNLWSPVLPSLTPVMMAVVGTVVITGGKLGVYMSKKSSTKIQKTEEETKATTTEEKLEKEWKK